DISATNVEVPGTINMGFGSLLKLQGGTVDLQRTTLNAEVNGFTIPIAGNTFIFFNQGIFDGYWGIGDPVTQRPLFYPGGIQPAFYFETQPYTTPIHDVTTRAGTVIQQVLAGPTFQAYLQDITDASGSNRIVRA